VSSEVISNTATENVEYPAARDHRWLLLAVVAAATMSGYVIAFAIAAGLMVAAAVVSVLLVTAGPEDN
jgi:hypothetical protein